MKRYINKWLCIVFSTILLLGTVGCIQTAVEPDPVGQASAAPSENGGEETVILVENTAETVPQNPELPEPTDTPEPTPEPTATPEPTPQPTRAPKEGDIATDRFPNYDTGVDADWSYQSDEVRIAVKRVKINEGEPDQKVYNVADIWVRNINSIRMGFGRGGFNKGTENPEKFATREHAILATNGTMNSGLVIHNGVEVKKNVQRSSHVFRSGVVILYRDGTVKLINRANNETYDYKKENAQHGGIWQALQFGPVLIQNGKVQGNLKKYSFSRRSRTLFGYYEPGHYALVTVDGNTLGMNPEECAELMASIGCTDAINLDGGQSTSMVFMGRRINSKPQSDRETKDMILIAEYDADGNAPELTDVPADRVRGE
ncbi:MAG: phosphodiester glycosidase family protein [Clostridia bacterium]|nr:phosphodiester glycosidase family protein [Clostridia bacterium]